MLKCILVALSKGFQIKTTQIGAVGDRVASEYCAGCIGRFRARLSPPEVGRIVKLLHVLANRAGSAQKLPNLSV
ncbi:MAG: hypothetical protein KME08_21300 [Aphanothece sp. CMT-3BRIN-NPC111]|nr:hypothetical protein [Aphanothece sp. CMT-3BRIN-NPC111]